MVTNHAPPSPHEPVRHLATGLLHLISSLDQSEREVWIYGSLPGMDRIIERLIEEERRPTTEEASSSPAPE